MDCNGAYEQGQSRMPYCTKTWSTPVHTLPREIGYKAGAQAQFAPIKIPTSRQKGPKKTPKNPRKIPERGPQKRSPFLGFFWDFWVALRGKKQPPPPLHTGTIPAIIHLAGFLNSPTRPVGLTLLKGDPTRKEK